MKKIYLLTLCFLSVSSLFAQLAKTGKDESSIFAKTTNVGIDIGESQVSFALNNYTKSIIKKNGLLYGISANGKNSDGLANLYNSGNFSPEGGVNGVFGFFYSNGVKITSEIPNTDSLAKALIKELNKKVNDISSSSSMSDDERNKFIIVISEVLKQKVNTFKNLIELVDSETSNGANSKEYIKCMYSLNDYLTNHSDYKTMVKTQKNIMDDADKTAIIATSKKYIKHNFYTHFGLNSQKFTYFKGWDTTDLTKSFEDVEFFGGYAGIGYNLRIGGHWMFGVKYSYAESNNYSTLGTLKYTSSSVKTLNGQSYTSKEDIVAKTGYYSKVYLNSVNFDASVFLKVDENVYTVLDLYYKGVLSNNDSLYASRSNIGIAASYFKKNSVILGGLYIELPDIDNNIERQKPTPNYRKVQNRMTIGVYAKININRLLGVERLF